MNPNQEATVIDIFKKHGLHTARGNRYSVKGQIAQLINGADELLDASSKICNVYFGIAVDAIGEDAVRIIAEKRISEL